MADYEAVIGLETHIQLNTASKLFCSCKADSWFDPPNTNICPVCTGLPGVLPSLNQAAVEKAIRLALALEADEVQAQSFFARKNYFYPDLPKGYQISQYDEPLALGGHIEIPLDDGELRVSIDKLHLEEDAGKTIREQDRRLIDFNRCGVPLVEMVTKPDLRSADQAAEYLIRLRQLLRWLGISEGDMEKGQLRCDANISIRSAGETKLNTKTEIKNVNSIEAVRQALKVEYDRPVRLVQSGKSVKPWTLDWDEDSASVRKMRTKETEADYRYFREPDLLPIDVSKEKLAEIKAKLPELPLARRARFILEYDLPAYDAEILTEEKSLSEYFEATVNADGGKAGAKTVSNWMMNDLLRMLRDSGRTAADLQVRPAQLASILGLLEDGIINTPTAKELLEKVDASSEDPVELVDREGLGQVSDSGELEALAEKILEENPEQVAAYKGGKDALLGWFVGQIMAVTQGKANPQLARQVLQEQLAK